MSFSKFKLHENILRALKDSGYETATDIQDKTFPFILEGKDIIASARTGSGKTGAFLIPTIDKLINTPRESGKQKGARVLILTPTRELAAQITTQANKYSKYGKMIKSVCVVGGVPYFKQKNKLSSNHDILIATPGRLIDYMNKGTINFANIETVILDEADRMLDMGFSDSVEEIMESTPKSRQTLLFSATLDKKILSLCQKFLNNPEEVFVDNGHEKNENIETKLYYVDNLSHKNDLLDHILNAEDINQAIIFTSTKRHCDELCDELSANGFFADAIHGDLNQRQRTRTLKKLQENKIQILVATDVAARGIDVATISHVINFDLPRDPEDFIHRIGRTGRAGRKGTAISFAGPKDVPLVPRIENFTKQTLEVVEIAGLEPKKCKPSQQKDEPKSRKSKMKRSRGNGSNRGSFSRNNSQRNSKKPREDREQSFGKKKSFSSRNSNSDDQRSYSSKRTTKSRRSDEDKPSFGERSKRDQRSKGRSSSRPSQGHSNRSFSSQNKKGPAKQGANKRFRGR